MWALSLVESAIAFVLFAFCALVAFAAGTLWFAGRLVGAAEAREMRTVTIIFSAIALSMLALLWLF